MRNSKLIFFILIETVAHVKRRCMEWTGDRQENLQFSERILPQYHLHHKSHID
jgi:hypothetical protein